MNGCQPWSAFCQAEGLANAQVLCLPERDRTLALASNATDACVADPTAPACRSYSYPDPAANADLDKLCGSMPDMPGCSVREACNEVRAVGTLGVGGVRVVGGGEGDSASKVYVWLWADRVVPIHTRAEGNVMHGHSQGRACLAHAAHTRVRATAWPWHGR